MFLWGGRELVMAPVCVSVTAFGVPSEVRKHAVGLLVAHDPLCLHALQPDLHHLETDDFQMHTRKQT
jgi:hypothetical protein